jgi:hypothetical protein
MHGSHRSAGLHADVELAVQRVECTRTSGIDSAVARKAHIHLHGQKGKGFSVSCRAMTSGGHLLGRNVNTPHALQLHLHETLDAPASSMQRLKPPMTLTLVHGDNIYTPRRALCPRRVFLSDSQAARHQHTSTGFVPQESVSSSSSVFGQP